MNFDRPGDELRRATELLFAPMRIDTNRGCEENLDALRQLDSREVNRVYSVDAWGDTTRHLTQNLYKSWCEGTHLKQFSLVGLALLRDELGCLDAMASVHPLWLPHAAMKFNHCVRDGSYRHTTLSAAGYVAAKQSDKLRDWCVKHVRTYPNSRPSEEWNPLSELPAVRDVALNLSTLGYRSASDGLPVYFHPERENVGLVTLLKVARTVDLEALAARVEHKPGRNRLVDAIHHLHECTAMKPGDDLLHLVLKPGVDLTPGRRQSSLLHLYASCGDVAACLKLLEYGHPTHFKDLHGRTALQVAGTKLSAHDVLRQTPSPARQQIVDLIRSWDARTAAAKALPAIDLFPGA